MFDISEPTPLVLLNHPVFTEKNVLVYIKRDDTIDEEISGNKWRKLKYNFKEAKASGYQKILTFGGAYSNHISATATAASRFGFKSIGMIRGEELNANSNPTLQLAHSHGMELHFISRTKYKERFDPEWLDALEETHQAYIIPEGGTNALALKGVSELVYEIDLDFDYLICPVGTGGTLAGLAASIKSQQTTIGIACLKGVNYLQNDIQSLIGTRQNWRLIHDYHFGGYAKFNSHLIEFINQFTSRTGIKLDPVYTGKMMFAVLDLIKNDKFDSGSRIICVHTGGLQGIAGFNKKYNDLLIS